jgi:hypothetical protein
MRFHVLPFYCVTKMLKKKIDPAVFISRPAFMQRVADLVRTGHDSYIQGTVQLDKSSALFDKFDRQYDVSLDRVQAHRHRATGQASARLLFLNRLFPDENKKHEILWILLKTAGETSPAADNREKWRNAKEDRIEIDSMELIRVSKAGRKNPVFTWRITKDKIVYFRNIIVLAIRNKRDDVLRQIILQLWSYPGFSGNREQIKKLSDLIKSEWKRSRTTCEKMPEIPARLGYIRRIKDKTSRVSELIKNAN